MKCAQKRIAIIGGGIAGLSAAWLLARKHRICLFERHATPGMGAYNFTYQEGDISARIDVPIRAFNRCYYKHLSSFYREIGIEFLRTDHSASYTVASDFRSAKDTYFAYRYLNVGGKALPVLAGLNKLSLKSLAVVKEVARFLVRSRLDQRKGLTDQLTIEQYLSERRFTKAFRDDVLYPSFAAICTCTYEAVKRYPANTIIDFMASGMLFDGIWRAKYGAEDPIKRMLSACEEVYCNASVASIRHSDNGVDVVLEDGTAQCFDHVVIASQANQALKLIGEDEEGESEVRALLSKVIYERSEVLVHTDRSLAPSRLNERAPVSFLIDKTKKAPMASICLNDLYPSLRHASPLFQTWNPLFEPDESKIVARSIFERPTVSLESLEAIERLQGLQRKPGRKVWFCGSYAMPGVPLLESAVRSSMAIAESFDCPAPWV